MSFDRFRRLVGPIIDKVIDKIFINEIYESVLNHGWHYQIYRFLFWNRQYKREMIEPTEDMYICKSYFKEHKDEIKKVASLLADTESKNVFYRAIKFRCTHDFRCLPRYSVIEQYFPKDIISISIDEVFIDCGACRGDTYRRLMKNSHGKFKKVVCFEMGKKNYSFLKKSCGRDSRLIAINKGVWNENTTIYFDENDSQAGHIVSEDDGSATVTKMKVCTIDSVKACSDATYIKMDIEGAEWEALHGAEKIIKKNHPKLAISIYHKPEDYIRLIKYIHELYPKYKFYVRHHSNIWVDTVLYAVP